MVRSKMNDKFANEQMYRVIPMVSSPSSWQYATDFFGSSTVLIPWPKSGQRTDPEPVFPCGSQTDPGPVPIPNF